MIPISKGSIFVEKEEGKEEAPQYPCEHSVLAVLVAPQTQQVAVLDVAPCRRCVPSHAYRPRVSTPQVFPDSVQRHYCCEIGIHPVERILSRSSAGPPPNPRSLEFGASLSNA